LPRIAVNKNQGTVTIQAKASKNPPKLTRAELATSPFIKYDQEVVIPQAGQGKPSFSGKKQGAKPSRSCVPIPAGSGRKLAATVRTDAIAIAVTAKNSR
jgi:hypothetical protein